MRVVIHGQRVPLGPRLRQYVEERLQAALTRLTPRVRQVTVELVDLNGPRGGVDKRCRIAVALLPTGTVQIEQTDVELLTAVGKAVERLGQTVRRQVQRWRQRRLRGPKGPKTS